MMFLASALVQLPTAAYAFFNYPFPAGYDRFLVQTA